MSDDSGAAFPFKLKKMTPKQLQKVRGEMIIKAQDEARKWEKASIVARAELRALRNERRFEAACAAMAGILANPTVEWKKNPIEKIAEQCVTHADSLLATLAKEPHD